MIQTDTAVIGGGAAGLMAAITAARGGAKTVIIEHMDRVGKKLLVTGNGKCNYTNALQGITYYRGENPAFVLPVFAQFGMEETIRYFKELGICPKEKNGYYYPASGQASSVLDVLRMETEAAGVDTYTSCVINDLKKEDRYFRIITNQDTFLSKTLIFATGLLASKKTGSDGSALPYIEQFGHKIIDVVPALVQLQGKQSFFKSIAGIRAEIVIKLYVDGKQIATEKGELQLTESGISGIPVFQISRFATRALKQKKRVHALLHFLPQIETEEEMSRMLGRRFFHAAEYGRGKNAEQALIGLFPKKLIPVLLKEAGIPINLPAAKITRERQESLAKTICAFRVDIAASKGFDAAQVCAGGVDTREIKNDSMESKIVPGLFFAGEVVDIDGTCGGYNLQWAWSSGYVAGKHTCQYIQE